MQKTTSANRSAMKGRNLLKPLILVGVAAIALAGLYLYLMHPPQPWIVRWQTERYLKRETGNSSFTVNFPFPSKAEMAKALPKADEKKLQKGPKTGKDFDTLKDEYIKLKTSVFQTENQVAEYEREITNRTVLITNLEQQLAKEKVENGTNIVRLEENITNQWKRIAYVKTQIPVAQENLKKIPAIEQELVPITADLWEFQRLWRAEMEALEKSADNVLAKARGEFHLEQRRKLDQAKTYSAIYRVIGEELFVAGQLLGSANANHQRIGLSMVLQAMQYARDDAQNYWLAARIAESYIWPNLGVAETDRRSQLNAENLLNNCVGVFMQNTENDNAVRCYEKLIALNPQRADGSRMQIARLYENAGDYKKALSAYRSLENTNQNRWVQTNIERLEQRIKAGR